MHGANRLGGNGVANSTVFGGLAGDAMALALRQGGKIRRSRPWRARSRARARLRSARPPLRRSRSHPPQALSGHVGRRRRPALARKVSRARARRSMRWPRRFRPWASAAPSRATTSPGWIGSIWKISILVSRAICVAADARTNSRGAHFPRRLSETRPISPPRAIPSCGEGRKFTVTTEPVRFTYVQPGQTLAAASGGSRSFLHRLDLGKQRIRNIQSLGLAAFCARRKPPRAGQPRAVLLLDRARKRTEPRNRVAAERRRIERDDELSRAGRRALGVEIGRGFGGEIRAGQAARPAAPPSAPAPFPWPRPPAPWCRAAPRPDRWSAGRARPAPSPREFFRRAAWP